MHKDLKDGWLSCTNQHPETEIDDWLPLYTHPSEHDLEIAEAIGFDKGYKAATAKTLTDEEIKQIFQEQTGFFFDDNPADDLALMDFARAILRKAQEK
jgi:hypothetical protein